MSRAHRDFKYVHCELLFVWWWFDFFFNHFSCIWAAALIVMGSCLIYTSYKQVKNYLSYPTIVNTQVQTKTSVKFPAITFCSASPMKNESLPKIPDLEYFLLWQSPLFENDEPLNFPWSYSEFHVPINASWVNDTANQIKDLFLFCKFGGKGRVCKSDMEAIVTQVGVCYTFNSRKYVSKNGHLMISRTGSTSGLLSVLIVNQKSYVYNDIMTAGIKVFNFYFFFKESNHHILKIVLVSLL